MEFCFKKLMFGIMPTALRLKKDQGTNSMRRELNVVKDR